MSNSRDKILQAIKMGEPTLAALQEVPAFACSFDNAVDKFVEVLQSIGGTVYTVSTNQEIIQKITAVFAGAKRVVSFCPEFADIAEENEEGIDPHLYEDVTVFIMRSGLGVAENGAVWITDNEIPQRVLPFITENLVTVIKRSAIVATMHDAYAAIAGAEYGFATFIAGPSKTADIEQSLVLGAHGPLTMTVFILDK